MRASSPVQKMMCCAVSNAMRCVDSRTERCRIDAAGPGQVAAIDSLLSAGDIRSKITEVSDYGIGDRPERAKLFVHSQATAGVPREIELQEE